MLNADYPMFNRRHFLKHLAGMSVLALPGAQFIQRLRAAAPALKKQNKSLIVMWMGGGPPTIDIWDLKPGTPTGGEFKPIKTSASGVEICEHMPVTAKQMKHLTIVRALTTNEGDHNRGRILMHTSHVPSPIINYPSIGAVASYQLTPKDLALPGFISVNGVADGPGFLGMNYAPFTVRNPGAKPENIAAPNSLGNDEEKKQRVMRRLRLFSSVEDSFIKEQHGDASKAHSEIYTKAFQLSASPLGEIFNLESGNPKYREKKSLMDEYGNNGFGKGCLLARRLVEAGVTCVEVDMGGWDLHNGIFPTLKNQRLPQLDKGMGTLVKDLVDRGMWKNTVIVWMGEFGRTPRINQNAGRDHWARCWSVVIGGGGIKGGQVFGATDADGTSVKGDAVASVGDLFSTIYKGMGLDPTVQIRDNLGRPMPLADGKVLSGLV
jgi:hypothetical protein